MSAQVSPDGMFYWDGRQWMSTLSPDGRSRWNGTAWVPTGSAFGAPSSRASGQSSREPTSWTHPLQLAVAGWYVIEGVYALSLPFWMSGPMAQAMNLSIQRQQQLYPTDSPTSADFTNVMTSMVGGALWVSAVFGVAIAIIAAIGALKRWTWMYYAVLILLGFGVVSLPIDVVDALGGSAISSASGFSLPVWTYRLALVAAIPSTALFIWMLVALVKRGPWAARKVTPPLG
ncbi:MAG TPA: hypothetical protein VKF16_07055 [Candidatus Dormibacteraeota bacterium]|nr:hypothetical protein [Candidatus Dormibacteraeota bacterium]